MIFTIFTETKVWSKIIWQSFNMTKTIWQSFNMTEVFTRSTSHKDNQMKFLSRQMQCHKIL